MSLTRKFFILLTISIIFIAIINIIAIYIFYSAYLKVYLSEKSLSRNNVTLEYINSLIEKQTNDEVDSIFTDIELEFFELLENTNGEISLNNQENIDIVINYLIKSGIAPKYIEEIIPTDNFGKILELIKNKTSAEYKFINNLKISIIGSNVIAIFIILILFLIFTKKTIGPIKEVTEKIRKLKPGSEKNEIKYLNKKDEIGLLITAINGLNYKLFLQENIRNRMLADISHELKTPITSIQCYLEGISDGVIKLNEKNLKSVTTEMQRLINLVNKIMEHEKFSRKKLELNLTKENVSDLIKMVAETHKKRLKENKQLIKIVGDEKLEINLDKDLFKQIVHNLIGNFLKYSGKRTLLTINITKNYIDFFDNGSGVNRSEIPFLTETFYQSNNQKSGDANERGIGIGLSLVQKIINSHGWKNDIKTDIGKGFSFRIYI